MKLHWKQSIVCMVAGSALVALPVHAERVDRSNVAVDAAGTETETRQQIKDSKTLLGNERRVSETSTVVDPKGLGNKTSASTTIETVTKPNGDVRTSTQKMHADGTYEEKVSEQRVAKHLFDDGVTETRVNSSVRDPVGLGNKTTTETREVIERRPDGTTSRTVTKEVNGKVVSRETSGAGNSVN